MAAAALRLHKAKCGGSVHLRCFLHAVSTYLQVMQVYLFIPGVISRCLRKSASHAGIAFISGVISRCLRKPTSHPGVYTWCYQQMSAQTCQSCRCLYLVLSANVCENLLVTQAFAFISGAISRCLCKPASHAGVYTWCY